MKALQFIKNARNVWRLIFASSKEEMSTVQFHFKKLLWVQPDAVIETFGSQSEWDKWTRSNPWALDPQISNSIRESARKNGLVSMHLGQVSNRNVTVTHHDILFNFMSARERALLDIIACTDAAMDWKEVRICGTEALSIWALEMRHKYPRFIGSQYLPSKEGSETLFPIQHQDLQCLTYPSGRFDIVVSIEILEHVADLNAALSEMARVLRPGGLMLSTFPFHWDKPDTVYKARMVGNDVEHLVPEPEYHSAPLDPQGALVFQVPGWDIVDIAKRCGFSSAGFMFYSSRMGGITGAMAAGTWIFTAQK